MKVCGLYRDFFTWVLPFCFLLCHLSVAQNSDERSLQKEQKALKNKISLINQLLESNRNTKQNSLDEYQDLGIKIKMQSTLIRNISTEISYMTDGIRELDKNVKLLQTNLKHLKKNYAKIITQTYKTRSKIAKIMFLLSSDSFYQMYKRLGYMKRYAEHRRKQALIIEEQGFELVEKIQMLKTRRRARFVLVSQEKREKESIKRERARKKQLLKSLSYKRKKLIRTKNKHEKRSRTIESKLASIIKADIKKSSLTARSMTTKFLARKGKLPWPADRGVIVRKFGKQLYPGMKVYTENNGVYIALKPNTSVKAVFEGEVARVFRIPGGTLAIVLRHGDYYTFYGNLKRTFVSQGQKVTTKQKLGVIYTNQLENRTTLDFQLWYKQSKKNPEYWISKV